MKTKLQWFIRREVGPFRRYWGQLPIGLGPQWTNNRKYALHFDTEDAAKAVTQKDSVTNFILVQEAP